MIKFFLLLFQKLGIDKPILYSLALRVWQMLAGPITLYFVARHFSATQQGFFYTFNSVLMLQIFFEMGLSFVIIQFISHEFAHLRWAKFGRITGGKHLSRFKQLVTKAFRWYLLSAILFALIVLPSGYFFFHLKDSGHLGFSWQLPWALLVFFTALNLIFTPLLAIIEGSGRVQEIYQLRFIQGVVASFLSWTIILFTHSLFNAVAVSFSSALLSGIWLYQHNKILMRIACSVQSFKKIAQEKLFSWRAEVWPMQWRIAISWMSGYFINQISVPILFYYHTPAVAGQMGMSLALSSMLAVIGSAWLNARAPFLGRLVAEKNWVALDQFFKKIVLQSSFIVLLACIGLIGLVFLFRHAALFQRILPVTQISCLALSALVTHWINCMAQYFRSHKREPFMVLSVIGAILVACAVWFFGKYYSSAGIVMAILIINILYGLPSALWAWFHYKRIWQHDKF